MSRETFESVNPATGEVLATYGIDRQREVGLRGAPGTDSGGLVGRPLSFAERKLRLLAWKSHLTRYMARLAQLVHDRVPDLAAVEVSDPGGVAQPGVLLLAVHQGLPGDVRVGRRLDRGEDQHQGTVVVAGLLAAGMDAD